VKITLLLLSTLGCLWCGCATPTYGDQRSKLRLQMREVVVEDGINAQEADIIAQSYFVRFGWGCGAAATVVESDTAWVAKTYFGFAADPREPIRIDKRTGRVTWSQGPTIENPKSIW
jgi:hypothetical protein